METKRTNEQERILDMRKPIFATDIRFYGTSLFKVLKG
jgi:hypothetical protein